MPRKKKSSLITKRKPIAGGLEHPAYRYAYEVATGKIDAPRYVIKQCHIFLDDWEGKNEAYCISEKLLNKIYKITKVLRMARGPSTGKTIYEALAGFQWLIVTAVLCTVHRDEPTKRKYRRVVLEVARKNGKSFIVGFLFILLFYLEPQYSRFYSVAPDGKLAREIKEALEPLLNTNADVFEEGEFKILRDYILHKPSHSRYIPLNYSANRLDGSEPSVYIVDEVGALPNPYAIMAMQSGQMMVANPLGFIISTKYPTSQNPFEDEVLMSQKILDGVMEDEASFSLLYEPDNTKNWATDDSILRQANPLALENDEVWDRLVHWREEAIEMESRRENFITKHCNIIYQGAGTEAYVSVEQVRKCKADDIDWYGKAVYVGVDLSITTDNCAVTMVAEDGDRIIALPMAFIPEGRIDEKSRIERLDYREMIRRGICIACGDMTVDYGVIEAYVLGLQAQYGVRIMQIGYDRFNCLSSAQKWEEAGYETVEVRQHSDTLHMPTKLLKEKIENNLFAYSENRLYEINFENCRCTFDTGLRSYVSKKKSRGKIDEVAATINGIYLLQQNALISNDDFMIQFI